MIAYWMRYNKASFHTKMIIDINLFPRDVNKKLRKSKRWKLIENECLLRKASGSFCGIHEIVSSYQIDTTRYLHDTRTKIMIIQSKREIKVEKHWAPGKEKTNYSEAIGNSIHLTRYDGALQA